MSIEQTGIVVGIFASLFGAIYIIFKMLIDWGNRIGRIELKVDTLWSYQTRRGEVEVISKGLGEKNSPLVIHQDVKEWVEPIRNELQDFYKKVGNKLSDSELAFEIEKKFGERMQELICIPHQIYEGACLVIAMEVAKEGLKL